MRLLTIRFSIFALILFGCSKKHIARSGAANSNCKDTTGIAQFYNNKSMELRVVVSRNLPQREGNTMINNWKSIHTLVIPSGQEKEVSLSAQNQYMYTVYGPVSTNVMGLGIIQEEKFRITPCSVLKVDLK